MLEKYNAMLKEAIKEAQEEILELKFKRGLNYANERRT